MKKLILILTIALLASKLTNAQNNDEIESIKTSLLAYISAGDKNDGQALKKQLHNDFRVALYDANKKTPTILDRNTYVSFIEKKKFGGYTRTAKFHNIQTIEKNMSTVNVTLTSPGKPTLKNFYSLVKQNDNWLVLQDYVTLIK
ncbi:nuclear transport factor 2 family protein [Seonamhaeicola marinus]|uniref:Nuclear transport factor 2 family protein n=1 Tax=Seonamhaeicola marinus TaxID=1912246 RepID=A0A5D0J9E0_9FLAO|nr:nuclear transport factor 2 family protein [Seonamhaeicola marinus]TYA92196.1 hypothetical protein FUA24_01840 [Seonamhaeicola marinus]